MSSGLPLCCCNSGCSCKVQPITTFLSFPLNQTPFLPMTTSSLVSTFTLMSSESYFHMTFYHMTSFHCTLNSSAKFYCSKFGTWGLITEKYSNCWACIKFQRQEKSHLPITGAIPKLMAASCPISNLLSYPNYNVKSILQLAVTLSCLYLCLERAQELPVSLVRMKR